jgi:hypothetical protein
MKTPRSRAENLGFMARSFLNVLGAWCVEYKFGVAWQTVTVRMLFGESGRAAKQIGWG